MPTPAAGSPHPHEFIAFGIPSLDRLMGTHPADPARRDGFGYHLAAGGRPESATLCLIGPDGTGKSNFSLHLAAEYWRRNVGQQKWRTTDELKGHALPRIVYASSDLSHERATTVWQAFWLDRPVSRARRVPFEHDWHRADAGLDGPEQAEAANPLKLHRFDPTEQAFSDFLSGARADDHEIAFLDLESTTSGDDWAFLHAMLAVMPTPEDGAPRHLLVIDAVEGLETLVGERDAFGQLQSRRARIAQVVRAAAGKCHLAIVVEEPIGGERLPEVFVADVVLRLRSESDRDYARRTAELEKVRGQKHIRGQHDFRIRQEGSKTGPDFNPDDPAVGCGGTAEVDGKPVYAAAFGKATGGCPTPALGQLITGPAGPVEARMAYIQVFPSLHYLSRDATRPAPLGADPNRFRRGEWRYAAFGIYQLDSMLWQAAPPVYKKAEPDGYDRPAPIDESNPETQSLLRYARRRTDQRPSCLPKLDTGVMKDPKEDEARVETNAKNQADLWRFWDDRVGVVRTAGRPAAGFDRMGLPAGSVTTLIGSDSTYKPHLAMAFLSQCFRTRHDLRTDGTHLPVVVANEADALKGQGVAVLLATYDTDRNQLRDRVLKRLLIDGPKTDGRDIQAEGLNDRVIVRALEPHHLPASLFVHIVRELVEAAKRKLRDGLGRRYPSDAACARWPNLVQRRRTLHGRIRFVIDDWSTVLAIYPEVQRDPLVVPFLMAYFRREGITALILATRPGHPTDRAADPLDQDIRELRRMADHHLHTWHVSFFDERRVAVTVQPSPVPGAGSLVRELRPARADELPQRRLDPGVRPKAESERDWADERNQYDPEVVVVDPHFEMYSGLPDGHPVPVPLEVTLYSERKGVDGFEAYLAEMNELFGHLFGRHPGRDIFRPKYGTEYEHLRELSYLQSEARLTHTLVMQVDEFWAESRSELYRQERYLTARTVDPADVAPGEPRRPLRMEDPFGLYTLSDALDRRSRAAGIRPYDPMWRSGPTGPVQRYQFFDLVGYDLRRAMKRFPIDKVPYSWDFGFLLCNRALWEDAMDLHDHRTIRVRGPRPSPDEIQTVRDVWCRLWKIADPDVEVHKHAPSGVGPADVDAEDEPRDDEKTPDALRHDLRRLAAHWIDDNRAMWTVPLRLDAEGRDVMEYSRVLAADIVTVPSGTEAVAFSPRFGEPGRSAGQRASRSQLPPDRLPGSRADRAVSWREFFGACKVVAKAAHHEHRPFDIDLMATESFTCLVLEVWFSEIRQALDLYRLDGEAGADVPTPRRKKAADLHKVWRPSARRDDLRSAGLKTLLGTPPELLLPDAEDDDDTRRAKRDKRDEHHSQLFRRALYRTMLLLDEALGRDQLAGGPSDQPLSIGARPANPQAVAGRHWYSTAAMALTEEGAAGTHVVVGLPGRFAVRGDWFLAVAQGSRSPRLGERVMDVLNSRRANICRLQSGVGLPVRDVFPDDPTKPEDRSEHWTPLAYADDQTPRERISYRELRKLGAFDAQDGLGRQQFDWLWRSSVEEYDIHARAWQKWLVKVFHEWKDWGRPFAPEVDDQDDEDDEDDEARPVEPPPHMQGKPWWDGFAEYDYYVRWDHHTYRGTDTIPCYVDTTTEQFERFDRSCDALIEALGRTANPPQLSRKG